MWSASLWCAPLCTRRVFQFGATNIGNLPSMDYDIFLTLINRVDVLNSRLGPLPDRLWTIKNVANFMDVSPMTVRRMMTHPHFPSPVILPSSANTYLPVRWFANDIEAWAKSYSTVV